jgi:small subunit ribosomal protein S21
MRLRKHYEKPSDRKAREKAEAIRRARKLARKKLQREGLLPLPKPRERGAGGRAEASRTPRFGYWYDMPLTRIGRISPSNMQEVETK